ncbi:MAG TPA: hypothetical protein PK152_13845 [Anaerolineales bacterium]|nr:hypothetical protein [Anaerolineae bacterium]HRJ55218.1 hypothetical protein [Anaerolineales bacterium]HRK90214.1 hypothetical protein [Anaerolineales bacterium]
MASKKKNGVSAGDGSVVIGGNVDRSNIVVGDNNVVSNQVAQIAPLFKVIFEAVESQPNLTPSEKEDVKAELQEVQTALEEPQPDETFIARRLRNIKRMAPEIVEVAVATLTNPVGGVAEVIKRIAAKMAEDANAK